MSRPLLLSLLTSRFCLIAQSSATCSLSRRYLCSSLTSLSPFYSPNPNRLILFACSKKLTQSSGREMSVSKCVNDKRLSPGDPNSFSRPDKAKVTHLHLDLTVDFKQQILNGSVTLTVEKVKKDVNTLVLDARHLMISGVEDEKTGKSLDFHLGTEGYVGAKLEITLPEGGDERKVKIHYKTTSKCTALQWLEASQTAGKVHPYLFSQCQAINARSMVPCQDTPFVKASYSANITAPKELTVLMSAVPQGEPEESGPRRVHRFLQKIPIQSYLIAIATGDIVSKKIGPRSRVWSEKEFVDKAAVDFEDTEIMLQKAEELCGPYVWGIYDILVLPPSFPYGGMENPCLTFATPTLLAGDKSLASVIAHEIAHSWTGNLVTNKNFEHFWLNEGFTVFTERKIVGLMFGGEPARHFSAIGGWKSLKYTIKDILKEDNPLTALVVNLEGVDPDDAFSVVPYEKGSTFLWYLEDLVGGPKVFEPFLRAYYEHFKFKSIDSYEFKDFFLDYFKDKNLDIDWEGWFKNPGMPPYKPDFDKTLSKICEDLKNKWIKQDKSGSGDITANDWTGLSAGQKIEFLALLLEEEPLKISTLEKMDQLYSLSQVENSEIKFRWIRLGLRGKWSDAIPRAVEMVTEQGRMKFLRPIYRDMYEWEESRQTAIDTFHKNKSLMMHVAVQGLEQDLKLV